MTLMVSATLLIPFMDAIAKILSTDHDISPASVALGRFIAQGILLCSVAAVLLRAGPLGARRPGAAGSKSILERLNPPDQPFRVLPEVVWVHLARGAFHGGASMLFFIAIKYMPLADAIAVFFVEPMVLLFLSAVFLGEEVGWPRRIAAVVGFGGAVLVIQPSYELFGAVSLLPLAVAALFATYLLFTRKFGTTEHPVTMQLWSSVGAMSLIGATIALGELLGAVEFQLSLPETRVVVGWFVAIGLVSTAGHLMIVVAFKLAPASILAPFSYLEIVTAAGFGYFVFDDLPGGLQVLGMVIIVGTGLFIFFRERALAAAA